MSHSTWGPSSLNRRMLCPGSGIQEDGVAESEGEWASEGSRLHQIVAEEIQGVMVRDDLSLDEMDLAAFCAETLAGLASPNWSMEVEVEIDCKSIHPLIDYGTPDVALFEPFGCGMIVDWKFGRVRPDPARSNLQLACYAVALSDRYQLEEVHAVIVMARERRVSRWLYGSDAIEEARQRIHEIVDHSSWPLAPLRPSKKACRYCRAAEQGLCPELLRQGAKLHGDDLDPQALSPQDVAQLLPLAESLKRLAGGIQRRGLAIAAAGGEVPGYELVAGRAKRSWSGGVALENLMEVASEYMSDVATDSLFEAAGLRSPAQIEKLLGGSKEVKDALSGLIDRVPGNLQLRRYSSE